MREAGAKLRLFHFTSRSFNIVVALAMTSSWDVLATHSAVIARLDRAIQYAETVVIESRRGGVLDSPPSRGMTPVMRKALWANPTPGSHHTSRNDTPAQEFLHHAR
ncbi:hypothetical protein ABIF91_005597 [Bradyrhizobium sp. USDA 241]